PVCGTLWQVLQKGKVMGVKVKEKVAASGVFWVFINHKGKRKSKCIGSEKAAIEFKSIIEARLKLGQSLLPEEPHSGPILEDYYKKFRQGYLETAVKDSTRRNYENCFRVHILPALGERRLGEVTRTQVKDFIASMVKKGLSRATIGITIRNLCTFINH